MRKLYSLFISLTVLSGCTKISYVGKTMAATKSIDVFVTPQSITKPYSVVGKGYLHGFTLKHHPEKIQKKSIELAMKKGADGVLIMDYFIPASGTSINTFYKTDSIGKSLVTTGNTSIQPVADRGFTITFIKYNQ